MDWSRFGSVLAPKLVGGWNLHIHTRQDALEQFVLFASGASILGPIGLANHAAANAALDALAHYRRARGLPALSLDWGWWSETGAVAGLTSVQLSDWAQTGFGSMEPRMAFDAMSDLISSQTPAQIAIFPVDWSVFRASPVGRSSLFAGFDAPSESLTANGSRSPARARAVSSSGVDRAGRGPESIAAADSSLIHPTQLSNLPEEQQRERVTDFLRGQLSRELGVTPTRIVATKPLNALGLDSLMAVQLRNRVQDAMQITIPVSRFIDGATVQELAVDLIRRLHSASEPPPLAREAPRVTPAAPAVDVGALSDADVERMLLELLDDRNATS
jgi:acyl carrier protein